MSQQVMVSGTSAVESAAASKSSASSSATFSSSSSSSFSSSSTSSKVVKQSVTSSSTTSSKSITSSSKTSSVSVKSSGQSYSDHLAGTLGIDTSKELERLKLCLSDELSSFNRDLFRLMPSALPAAALEGGTAATPALALGGALDESLVRLDADSVRSCVDKANSDRLKLNFDMTEYESESISVKTVGNKIEVHAQKKSKKGDEERSEEFSRVYELPTSQDVDPTHVTSSIYQDGVLTIELPVAEALGQ